MFREILCTDFGKMAALRTFRFAAATLAELISFATIAGGPGPPATALALRFLDRLFTVWKTAIVRKDTTI